VAVAERLLAVQAQDPRGARLAIRARSDGLTAADVDRALTRDRSLVITWLNRGTLHLVSSEDYPWLQALTTPPLQTAAAGRLALDGVSPATAERAVVNQRSLAADSFTRRATRPAEAADLPRPGWPSCVLFLAALRGVVRGR
jgi:hypothetical protein